jgi:hypothetical protein
MTRLFTDTKEALVREALRHHPLGITFNACKELKGKASRQTITKYLGLFVKNGEIKRQEVGRQNAVLYALTEYAKFTDAEWSGHLSALLNAVDFMAGLLKKEGFTPEQKLLFGIYVYDRAIVELITEDVIERRFVLTSGAKERDSVFHSLLFDSWVDLLDRFIYLVKPSKEEAMAAHHRVLKVIFPKGEYSKTDIEAFEKRSQLIEDEADRLLSMPMSELKLAVRKTFETKFPLKG